MRRLPARPAAALGALERGVDPGLRVAESTKFWSWQRGNVKVRAVALGDRGAQLCAATQGYDGQSWEAMIFGSSAHGHEGPRTADLLRGTDTMGDPGPFADAARHAPVYAVAYPVDVGWNVKKYVATYLPGEGRGRAWGDYCNQSWGTAHGVAVSDDGSTVAVMTDDDALKTNLYVYDAHSGARRFHWSATGANDIWAYGVDCSDDAARIYVNLGFRPAIVDGWSGATLFIGPQGSEGAFAAQSISGDGSTFATSRMGRTRVFRDSGGGYQMIFDHHLPSEEYQAISLDLDDSGERLVVAAFDFTTDLTYGILTADLRGAQGEVLWFREWTGTGAHQNAPWEVSITGDGERFVVGTWGDEGMSWPEVRVFDFELPDPWLEIDMPGSVHSVDIDDAGQLIAVGNQTGHANDAPDLIGMAHSFHLGGADLLAFGTPALGQPVDLEIHGEAGRAYTVAASSEEEEGSLPGYEGVFYLDTGPGAIFEILEEGTIPPSGVAETTIGVPGNAGLEGRRFHLQAGVEGDSLGALSNELVVRILP